MRRLSVGLCVAAATIFIALCVQFGPPSARPAIKLSTSGGLVANVGARAPRPSRQSAIIARLKSEYGNLPLSFEPSLSKSDPVKFRGRAGNLSVELTPRGAIFVDSSGGRADHRSQVSLVGGLEPIAVRMPAEASDPHARAHPVIEMRLEGANASARIEGADKLAGVVSYFLGSDSRQWRTGIPTYARVKYRQVYPGIDLVYYGNHQELECDLNLAPGAKPSRIRLAFSGADHLEINRQGDLVIRAPAASFYFTVRLPTRNRMA